MNRQGLAVWILLAILSTPRAAAGRDNRVTLGHGAAPVTILSLGEPQPGGTEESAACWQKNRRGHFRFTAKYLAGTEDPACTWLRL